jgi:hypothetical protein
MDSTGVNRLVQLGKENSLRIYVSWWHSTEPRASEIGSNLLPP